MKKIVLIIALGFSTMSFNASPTTSLYNEITEKVSVDLSTVEVNQYQEDYVTVNFTITDGKINVLSINGTQQALKELVINELQEMQIESDYNTDAIYRYKFTFEKI